MKSSGILIDGDEQRLNRAIVKLTNRLGFTIHVPDHERGTHMKVFHERVKVLQRIHVLRKEQHSYSSFLFVIRSRIEGLQVLNDARSLGAILCTRELEG